MVSIRAWQVAETALESSNEKKFNEGTLYSGMGTIKRTNKGTPSTKETGRKSITQTQRELEAIKKGLLSRSCCHGARQLHDPKQGWNREKGLPSIFPLLLQVPLSHWLKLPRSQLAKKPHCIDASLQGCRTGRERKKTDLGSREETGHYDPQKYCLTMQSWCLYRTDI